VRLRLADQRPLMSYITVTLMTFDKKSNGRRIEVEYTYSVGNSRMNSILRRVSKTNTDLRRCMNTDGRQKNDGANADADAETVKLYLDVDVTAVLE